MNESESNSKVQKQADEGRISQLMATLDEKQIKVLELETRISEVSRENEISRKETTNQASREIEVLKSQINGLEHQLEEERTLKEMMKNEFMCEQEEFHARVSNLTKEVERANAHSKQLDEELTEKIAILTADSTELRTKLEQADDKYKSLKKHLPLNQKRLEMLIMNGI